MHGEAHETFIGHSGNFSARGGKNMNAVLSMVDRESGRLRSIVLYNVTSKEVTNVLDANVAPGHPPADRLFERLSPRRRGHGRA